VTGQGGRPAGADVGPGQHGDDRGPGPGPGPGRRFGWRLAAGAALAALAAVTAAAAVAPVLPAAAASAGGNGSFGLTPLPASDGQAAPYFMMNVAAGHSAAGDAVIANLDGTVEQLKLSRATGVTAANGGSAFSRSYQRCSGPGCWVSGLVRRLALPAGTRERLPFTVHVPAGTRPGQYLAGITAELATKPQSVGVGSNGAARARAVIIQQVTVGVAVTVGSLSRLSMQLRIPGVSGAAVGATARLEIAMENTGQRFAHAAGKASCTAAGTRHSFAVRVPTILPHDQAVIAVNAPGLPEGSTLPCAVRLSYGNGLIARWAGSVTLPAPPRTHVVHIGPGAYAVVPAGGIPVWAIALLVIGVLALVAVTVLLVRTRRLSQAPW